MKKHDVVVNGKYFVTDVKRFMDFLEQKVGKEYGDDLRLKLGGALISNFFTCIGVDGDKVTLSSESDEWTGVIGLLMDDVTAMFKRYTLLDADEDYEDVDKFIYSGTATVCILRGGESSGIIGGEKGVARLKEGDTYNERKGREIAYKKAWVSRHRRYSNFYTGRIKEVENVLDDLERLRDGHRKEIESLSEEIRQS